MAGRQAKSSAISSTISAPNTAPSFPPPRGARRRGAAPIFDEIVTGFRVAPGGMQQVWGIKTDPALSERKSYLGWCDPAPTLAALKDAGIDAVTLANNHMLDCGTAGLTETQTMLHGAGIASFGAGEDETAAARPFIHRFAMNGAERTLVVFGGFERRARYDHEYNWYAGPRIAGIGKLDADRIAAQIASLRDTLPNPTFVVFPHWGVDYAGVTQKQRDMAAALAAAGADLIIGHGAHIVQDAEMIDGCAVLYNIGNFVWNTPGRFSSRAVPPYGLAVALEFTSASEAGATLRLYPIVTDNSVTEFRNRPVTSGEFEHAQDHLEFGPSGLFSPGRDAAGFHLELVVPSERDDSAAHIPHDLAAAPEEPQTAELRES
ncbi:hypothetical protein DC366_15190 [Pelagivirga sediminicola]|uniref:Capsule synthesis protein CapA domain-containing protein n=1 Tax=Pelagivirga sediminicola TaxID=2170575 RepID=A0A2T7G492_9RHOB|nr:CapA family protein [Pelagivirga sediminicola]PVA09241.1 hypothetical protein DC366_15190 [Pelagivirga sediminicola]